MSVVIRFGDLFAGCGGTSTGAMRAIAARGWLAELVAVNHWPVAVATHQANHSGGAHYCMDLSQAEPEDLVPGRKLDLLVASPECTHFSRARGGKPVNDQRRSGADWVLRWLERLDVTCLLVENVKEFMSWGDVVDGRPVSQKRGRQFLAWLDKLRALGYSLDHTILNAADFGDVTTRERFFLIARKDGRPIRWPTPTHSKLGTSDMFGTLPKWRAAREIIDWSNLGDSLFGRSKPLSLKTRLRIARGAQRFWGVLAPLYIRLLDLPADDEERFITGCTGAAAEAFIAVYQQNAAPRSTDEPLGTLLTEDHISLISPLAEPVVMGQQSDSAARPVRQPIMAVTTGGVIRVATPTAEPFLDVYYQTGVADSVDEPLSTATTKPRHALVSPLAEPFAVPHFGEAPGQLPRVHDLRAPLPAVTNQGAGSLVTPIASVITPGFAERDGQAPRVHDIEEPLPAIAATGHLQLATATIKIPIALTDVDPKRLVVIDGVLHLLDIRFRMLTNQELAAAMGFPPDYQFSGNKGDVTKQIGNAVCVNLATALVGAILDPEQALEASA